MRRVLLLCLAAAAAVPAALAQREEKKAKLFYKSGRPVAERRVSARTAKLPDPKDKSKAVDFKIQNVDVAGGLEVSEQYWGKASRVLVVAVRNKGVAESKEAYLAVLIKRLKKGVKYQQGSGPGYSTSEVVVHGDGKAVPGLKPGAETVLMFDFSGVNEAAFVDGEEPHASLFGGNAWIECYLVTEPIVVK